MKLRCNKDYSAHWGSIFQEGHEYKVVKIIKKPTDIITDDKMYWEKGNLIADSYTWILKGYTPKNLHEVMPGYITQKQLERLYVKRIKIPHAVIKGDDNKEYYFALTSAKEFIELGADITKKGTNIGRPTIRYTVHIIDEYFDYQHIRRDNKINELLNEPVNEPVNDTVNDTRR